MTMADLIRLGDRLIVCLSFSHIAVILRQWLPVFLLHESHLQNIRIFSSAEKSQSLWK